LRIGKNGDTGKIFITGANPNTEPEFFQQAKNLAEILGIEVK